MLQNLALANAIIYEKIHEVLLFEYAGSETSNRYLFMLMTFNASSEVLFSDQISATALTEA